MQIRLLLADQALEFGNARLVGQQQADLHFFREALRLWDAASPDSGAPTSTRSSKR